MNGYSASTKQLTVVYAADYEGAANIIEARIQAFPAYTSRLWDVSFYEANKATLDSNQRVLFLGSFDENPAAQKYAKVFARQEKSRGCFYSIAGSKALIYPTGEAEDTLPPRPGNAQFYTDAEGNTSSRNERLRFDSALFKPALLKTAAFGIFGSLIPDRLFSSAPDKKEQLENGCEEFMQKQFASWVGVAAP